MGCYVTESGGYYEGDRQGNDIEVPQRPSATSIWDGAAWQQGPQIVPQSVSMRQARLALLQAGLLSQVDTAIAAMPSPQKEAAQIQWGYASSVDRNNELTIALGPALGLSDTQLDQLFITAAGL